MTSTAFRPAAQYLRVSSEMQRASMELQRSQIASFAAAEGYEVVRTYADTAKSGLRLAGRPALQQLLADVLSGSPPFTTILVQDVSRWGRFQDPDESAHYEYICRAAGVAVRYCAETFEATPSATSGILKAVKRLMAAEFSRELSAKVRRAQFQLAGAGFKMGGAPGYGLRRRVIDKSGRLRAVLEAGETRLRQSDRVVLAPGPPDEIGTVRRIYDLYLRADLSLAAIADVLNSENVSAENGRPWASWTIGRVLTHPKYVGVYVFGQRRRTLDSKRISNAPADWLRVEGAQQAIISRRTFHAACRKRRERSHFLDDWQMVQRARRHVRSGHPLTQRALEQSRLLPSASAYRARFGPLCRLRARVGIYPVYLGRSAKLAADILPGFIDADPALVSVPSRRELREMMLANADDSHTAFSGDDLIAAGRLWDVAAQAKLAHDAGSPMILVFHDGTGAVVDLDLRGEVADVVARVTPQPELPSPPTRGRPRLGVAAREVTLLPRHWEWLATQPGGASAALRKLVEEASKSNLEADQRRHAQTATYKVMYALAGHLPHFEDALRSLYGADEAKFTELMAEWPIDIRRYVASLASAAFDRPAKA